jgi:hypothetical protein
MGTCLVSKVKTCAVGVGWDSNQPLERSGDSLSLGKLSFPTW